MAQDTQSPASVTQKDFVETPYEDATWEVVGEIKDSGEFEPMEIEALGTDGKQITDPMFADYGGFPTAIAGKRWHLPEHLSVAKKDREAEAQEEPGKIALTEAEVEALKAEAFASGRSQGFSEAEKANAARVAQAEARVGNLINDLAAQLKEHMIGAERSAIDLSLAISKKIVDGAVEINPEYIVPVVNQALSLAGGASIRKVRVSPEDMEFIQVIGVGKHLKSFDGSWQFEKDDSIRSGCVVETSAGEVDFQLDAAWERIKDNVLKSLA